MDRNQLALWLPPIAVARAGAAGATAAPLSAFWLAGIASLGYGLSHLPQRVGWLEIIVGVVLWGFASWCAKLVLKAVADDQRRAAQSTLQRQRPPSLDEGDPLKRVP